MTHPIAASPQTPHPGVAAAAAQLEAAQLLDQLQAILARPDAARVLALRDRAQREALDHYLRHPEDAVEDLARRQREPHQRGHEPVHGDVLPALGSQVLIRLGSSPADVPCEVTGYYAHEDLGGNVHLQRVFVRVRLADGSSNARLLSDVRRLDGTAFVKGRPAPSGQEPAGMPAVARQSCRA